MRYMVNDAYTDPGPVAVEPEMVRSDSTSF